MASSMTCRFCHRPLSVGTALLGCHFCGAFPRAGLVEENVEETNPDENSPDDDASGRCRLCLSPNKVSQHEVSGCSVCGCAAGLVDGSASTGELDELGFPVPSEEYLAQADTALRSDYDAFVSSRARVLEARQAFVAVEGGQGRQEALKRLQEAWEALRKVVYEGYCRADLWMRLEYAATPGASPEDVAGAVGVLLRAIAPPPGSPAPRPPATERPHGED